jgi:prepilin-type N-terminal cleavage/methylation domain-containing protein
MSRRDDSGFTAIELIIAMMLMLIIIVPITSSFILGMRTTTGGMQDTTNSSDAQVLSAFFDTDVTNAESVATSGSCGGASTVLQLSWTDGSVPVVVAYRTATASGDVQKTAPVQVDALERVRCESGASVEQSVVARAVLHSGGIVLSCDSGSCPGTSPPRRITMKLVEHTSQVADTGSTGSNSYAVTAVRKVVS